MANEPLTELLKDCWDKPWNELSDAQRQAWERESEHQTFCQWECSSRDQLIVLIRKTEARMKENGDPIHLAWIQNARESKDRTLWIDVPKCVRNVIKEQLQWDALTGPERRQIVEQRESAQERFAESKRRNTDAPKIETKLKVELKKREDSIPLNVADDAFKRREIERLEAEIATQQPEAIRAQLITEYEARTEGEHTASGKSALSDWRESARAVADECFDHDTHAKPKVRDSLKGYSSRVMEEMQRRDISGPRGIITNPNTIQREALQGKKWWSGKTK